MGQSKLSCKISFKHFIATRVNIKFNISVDYHGNLMQSDAWLEKRLSLFYRILLPSISNQTCSDFTWLIYFDTKTKQSFKDQTEEQLSEFSNGRDFRARYVKSQEEFFEDLRDQIASRCPDKDYVLTTRIDSDDAFHRNAVTKIQNAFCEKISGFGYPPIFAINLSKGLQFQIGKHETFEDISLFCLRHPSNPFITLAEKQSRKQCVTTVYNFYHDHFMQQDEIPLIQVDDGRYWLWTIHKANMITSGSIGWPTLDSSLLGDCGITPTKISIKKSDFLKNYVAKLFHITQRGFSKLLIK